MIPVYLDTSFTEFRLTNFTWHIYTYIYRK